MVIVLIVFLTNRKDYEPFLADVVFAFDGLEDSGIISHRFHRLHTLPRPNWHRFQVINSLKDLMEQRSRYKKGCLSKKEETTCIGNENSGAKPKRFNVKRA